MPRGRVVLLGVVIALVSVVITAALFLFVIDPTFLVPRTSEEPQEDRNGTGQSREIQFDPEDRVQVVVALQRLPRGFTIPPGSYNNAVGVREWPAAAAPLDAVIIEEGQDPEEVIEEQVEGQIIRVDTEREQPILRANLAADLSQLAAVGSDVAAQLAPGARAVAIPVDKLSSVGYAVQPGDRVDVVLSFTVVDVDEEFQSALPNWIYEVGLGVTSNEEGERITASVLPQDGAIYGRIDTIPPGELANIVPSEPQRPRLVTQRTVVCAPVMMVGEAPPDGDILGVSEDTSSDRIEGEPGPEPRGARPDVVVLGVTAQEVNVLRWAVDAQVDISLAICSVQEGAAGQTSSVTLQYVFETYNVPVPPRLPYSLEPSLREAPLPTPVAP